MKRGMAVLVAFAIGFAYSPPGAVALAEENEEKIIEAEDNAVENKESEENTTEKEDSFIDHLLGNFFGTKEEKENLPDDNDEKMKEKEALERETSGLKNLQIPQKFEVVIDPWEMDRKGQIYSEQYIISNAGDTPGILTLSNLICSPREQSGVVVRTDKEGLHDSGDKSIYMEMLFGNGERIVFSEESSQYQTELEPGEELSVCFVGEVNENALGKWKNDDIAVSLVYSWKMEETLTADDTEKEEPWIDDHSEDIEKAQLDDSNKDIPKEKDPEDLKTEDPEGSSQTDISSGNSEEISENDGNEGEVQKPQDGADMTVPEEKPSDHIDEEVQQPSSPDPSTGTQNGQEVPETQEEVNIPEEIQKAGMQEEQKPGEGGLEIVDKEEEEIKNIELRETQKIDVTINSWKVDENGKITSAKYMLKNAGDTAGTWSFSKLVCNPGDRSGIKICTDLKEVHVENGKTVYMELILGNGKKVALSQKDSEYEVKLEPGEELSVCFVGEINRSLLEAGEDVDIEVTAICSWNMEQPVME